MHSREETEASVLHNVSFPDKNIP